MLNTRYKIVHVDGLTTVVHRLGKTPPGPLARGASPWLAEQLEDFERRKEALKRRRRKRHG